MPWLNPSSLTLYHGTIDLHLASLSAGVNVSFGRVSTDFSLGFYTTTNLAQARAHARNMAHRLRPAGARRGAVLSYLVDRDALAGLSCLAFVKPNSDFWDLVDWCRAGNRSHHAGGYYDVVFGPVAQDVRLRTIHLGYDQVSFHAPNCVGLLVNVAGSYV
jgi:hypothetical protein